MSEQSETREIPAEDTSTVGGGLLLGLVMQLIQIPFTPLVFGWVFIGVTQLAYILPAIHNATKLGLYNRRKGLIIAASLVALLNVTCFGVLGGSYLFG